MQHDQLSVDGVTVHHFGSEEELTSISLIFAAGTRDESLPTCGSLHALEHLCLGAVRNTPLEINGVVDRLTTQFTAYGRTALVGPWLTSLCRALADPPVDRLEAEAQVLLAEGDGAGTPADPLHLVRFGNRDLGLGLAPPPTPRSLSVERLRADALRWFSAANALLVVDGPLPELHLPLPDGGPPARSWPAPVRVGRPEAVLLDAGCVAVSLVLPPPDPAGLDQLAGRLLESRLAEAVRHERGLAYHVESEGWPLADRGTVVTAWAEPGRGKGPAASEVLLSSVSSLLREGPSADELEVAREQVQAGMSGREGAIGAAVRAGLGSLLFGSPDPPVDADLLAGATLADAGGYLRTLGTDLLYLLDEEAGPAARAHGILVRDLEPAQPALPTAGTTYRPPLAVRVISAEARTVRLVTTEDALWFQVGSDVSRVRWADAAGLREDPDEQVSVLYSVDGTAIAVDDRLTGSDRALAEIRSRVPRALWYVSEPEEDEPRERR